MQDNKVEALVAAIAALEGQRGTLGDEVLELAVAPLRARLAHLRPPVEPGRRLRQVSVLFLDIVGSTQLIQRLEPEDVQLVVDGALAAFTDVVALHGGEVLRYAGDNLKVAFGANGRREDDAERAVNCGLALLQEAARQGEAVRRAHGHPDFGARVGVHTGPVLRGGGIENDNSLSGLTVNVAARMEQAALPGTLRISIDTHRQVQGCFDVLEQPALQVRGLPEPMRTFVVLAPRERRLRGLRHGVDGVASALVGRDDELGSLQRLAAEVFAPGGRRAVATVIGEAGLGKSRLLAEFEAGLPAAVRAASLWRASSHPQALHQPYALLRDLLFWHHGVRDSDTQSQAQQTFAAALAPVFGAGADEQTALLGQLIGLDYAASPFVAGILRDGRQLRERGLHAWLQYLRLQAAAQPLVLVLDDLQWADDASLGAIEHLVAEASALPIVVLCAARPELLQRRPGWGAAWTGHLQLSLAPLAAPGREALASGLLARFATPVPALRALLSEQAAGNPYYMESLLQMLVDTGVIQTAGEHWQLQEDRLEGLQVPPTLVGVLQATLDALDPDERRSLQQASVVGTQFWDEALAAIDPRAPEELLALSLRELALPQPESAFEGTREYAFRHHLLHQVTYGTVLRTERREGHHQAALWLQARSAGRESELSNQIAEHFERAGLHEQAIAYWLRAAEDASRRQADTAALAHAARALALDDGSDLRRLVRLHRVRLQVLLREGGAAEHRREIEILESLADRLDDDVLRLSLANDQVWRLCLDARLEDAVALGERRLARAAAQSPADAARVHNVMFVALDRLGRFDEALAHGEQGLEKARAAGDRLTEAAIYNNIGVNHLHANRVVQSREWLTRALATYQAAASRNGALTVHANLALIDELLCRLPEARDQLVRLLQECRDIGSRGMQAVGSANLSLLQYELGDCQGGFDTALQALHFAQVTGDRSAQAYAHRAVRYSAHALGRLPEALEHARASRALFEENGLQAESRMEWAAAIRTRQALGEQAQALEEAEALLAALADQVGWGAPIEGPMYLHQALAKMDDSRAGGLLATAHQSLVAMADVYAGQVPRDVFMGNTVIRRQICEAWAAAGRAP